MKRAITALRVEQRSSSISSLLWTRPVAVQLRPLVTVLTRGRVLRRCSCSSKRFFSSDVSPNEVEDAFHVLGLASHASPKEVKAVFFRLARELHPDANMGRREGEARLAVISTAFKLAFDAANGKGPSTRRGQRAQQEHRQAVTDLKRRAEDYDWEEDADYVVKQARSHFEMQYNGEKISNSGPDWGGYFWMMESGMMGEDSAGQGKAAQESKESVKKRTGPRGRKKKT